MATSHGRLAGALALLAMGTGVAYAVTETDVTSSRKVVPKAQAFPPLDPSQEAAGAAHDVLGAQASSSGDRDRTRKAAGDAPEGKAKLGDAPKDGDEAVVLAALIPGGDGDGLPLPCGDANACVDRVGRLVTDVADPLPRLPLVRECRSSIGGAAVCFDFGDGKYLLGDGPADGETELGFCSSSGYYHVSGPFLGGGISPVCPGVRPRGRERRDGRRMPPTAYDCTSRSGGRAICYDLGRGNYIVSDSLADGQGELGFCSEAGYYYVSAPSGKRGAGVDCPGA